MLISPAPPSPWTMRASVSSPSEPESAQAREASVNSATPIR